MEISWIDIGIVIILLISIASAMFHGFVREALSLASWIAAIWLAVMFSHQVALLLPASIDNATFSLPQSEFSLPKSEVGVSKLRVGIAFTLIVIGTLIVGSLLSNILSQFTKNSVLRGVDRLLGVFFGFFRGAAIVVLLILAASYTNFPASSNAWKSSQLLPPFEMVAKHAIGMMPFKFSKYFSLGEEAAFRASDLTSKI